MSEERSRYGLMVSALGAILLAVAVFLPWYGLSLSAQGAVLAQQVSERVAAQFGNAALQSYAAGLHGDLAQLVGHQFAAVSAHQVLHDLNVVLLVLAGLAVLDALLPLARSSAIPDGAGGSAIALGLVAAVCVLYRMFDPPSPAGELVSLSLREGAWLALLGSLMIVLGGLWPRCLPAASAKELPGVHDAWAGLSGWTPGA